MGIYERHYKKLLSLEFLKQLTKGNAANITSVGASLQERLKNTSNILYQHIDQPERQVFNIEIYNKALQEIAFDIKTAYEELTDISKEALKDLNFSDLYNKINNAQLNDLEAALENLLFLSENADFFFEGVFDIFSDTSKIDLENSTEGVLNLKEQMLSLPFGQIGTDKIKTNHLFNMSTPQNLKVVGSVGSEIIASVPGSTFGNAFIDTTSAWAVEVLKPDASSTTIEFQFPLAGDESEEVEVFVNRFEIVPHSPEVQRVQVFTSNDNVNYIEPLGYEGGIITNNQNLVYAMDFETTLVQYIRIRITKDNISSEVKRNSTRYNSYIFGLKNFSAYSTGRVKKAVYQSKPFSFVNSSTIKDVALKSEFSIPNGTNLRFSVAGYDDKNNQVSSFIPILPLNDNNPDNTKVVSFGGRIKNTSNFNVEEVNQYGEIFLGKPFYRIGNPLTPTPIFGTAELFRGFNCWHKDSSNNFEIKTISDLHISFAESNVESVYDVTTEVPPFEPVSGTRTVKFTTTKPVYYNQDRGHQLIPDPSKQGSFGDIAPNYAIYSVTQISTRTTFRDSFRIGSNLRVSLPVSNFIVQSTSSAELPRLSAVGGLIYQPGIDYIIETETIGGYLKSTGYINIPNGSSLLANGRIANPNQILVFEWTPDTNVTHKVASVVGNVITMDELVINPGDQIKIEYRFVPTAPNTLIKSSVRVASSPSSSSTRDFYIEGTDYVFDVRSGIIQRIPSGNIPENGSVYVLFSYRNTKENIYTFTTWAYIETDNPISIDFDLLFNSSTNTLVANSTLGEAFYINTPNGVLDLTNALSIPELTRGWVQFIVRSKDPVANPLWQENLIDQVIQLRDRNKKRIFRTNGEYFSQITAFREPMKQRTLNHLRVNTLKSDHTVFAIDDITNPNEAYIVVNFSPNSTNELYQKIPSSELEVDGSLPDSIDEEFLVTWYSENTESNTKKIAVRIELERSSELTDGGITPKVSNYHLRVSL